MATNHPLKHQTDAEDADEDLDDLDELLDQFGPTVSKSQTTPRAQPKSLPHSQPPIAANGSKSRDSGAEYITDGLTGDFAAELAREMENLMREITPGEKPEEGSEPASEEEQAKLFKAAWEAMLIEGLGEGKEIGEDFRGVAGNASGSGEKAGDFANTIRKTMDKRKEGDEALKPKNDGDDPLAALLASLGVGDLSPEDLAALSNIGLDGSRSPGEAPESEEALQGMLEQMMSQLISRELLNEPLEELISKYPGFIEKNASTLPDHDKKRYEEQLVCAKKIVAVFDDPNYSDSNTEMNAHVVTLMTELQSHGSPPSEILGPLPPGLGIGPDGKPQTPEGCAIV